MSWSRFFRGEPPAAGPFVLNQRRVFILPTRQGLVFVLLLLLVLLIAFVYNNNLAYMLGFLMASIFFVTILHSFKSLAGLTVRSLQGPAVFAGQNAEFQFVVHNPGEQPRPAIDMHLQDSHSISLAPGEVRVVALYRDTNRRGWLSCDTLTLSSTYPLGLFRAWSPLRFDSKALVYPSPAPPGLGFPEVGITQEGEGQYRFSGDDFFGLKVYQSGDSIRQIHWKSYAKGRELQSKLYVGASSAELWLNYESTPGNGVEERLSQLCRWVLDAEQAGVRYGLKLPGIELACDKGQAHYLACLRALALF